MENGYFKIRPSARLIHTIGKDLIGDSYAALVELVKNAYDADAKNVHVVFRYISIEGKSALSIVVKDDGHGMSFDTVINKWLVPATNDKLSRKKSPSGRAFQGRKGIGRFAAAILGQEMTLTTTDSEGVTSTAVIDWRIFNTEEYLENVKLLVEKNQTQWPTGTTIEILAKNEMVLDDNSKESADFKLSYWSKVNIDILENELRKLISPFQEFSEEDFKINLSFIDCPFEEYNNREFKIEAFPIINLYDYRISGIIESDGKVSLIYENNVDSIKQSEKINTNYKLEKGGSYCGEVKIDFRVFDREPEAIDNLINKGLIDPISKKFVGKRDAKRLLDDVYGINIYRSDFRIRPYGNGGFDWLDLDKDRIQDFTLRVSNNQVVGFITIEPEERSDLQEKSARDGLKENNSYLGLKELCKKTLRELELRRLTYRERTLKSRKGRTSIQKSVEDLFNFSDLTGTITARLNSFKINNEGIKEISDLIKKEEEKKTHILEEIQKTIAIYQGQATLGKIVSYILHEGRKSIHYFRNEAPVIRRYLRHYKATKEEDLFNDINTSIDGFEKHSSMISDLFQRVNPLASQTRGKKIYFKIKDCIEEAKQIFNQSIIEKKIDFQYSCDDHITIYGWKNDLYIALANLIENSIYWIDQAAIKDGKINLNVRSSADTILIDYEDNGPGLTKDEIKTEIIFEPGYSKKLDGTGLGLAIAGEAVERLNGRLMALDHIKGVYFQIEIVTKNE